jgi:hypothetical protein
MEVAANMGVVPFSVPRAGGPSADAAACYADGEVIDTSKIRDADDEYTPEQRRILNAELDEAEKGPYYGPFKSPKEVEAFLAEWIATHQSPKLKKTG